MKAAYLALLALAPAAAAYGHTVDSVGGYRVEIGWLNEPVVTGEANAVVLLVSPLDPGLDPEDQGFSGGIEGLRKTVRVQLVYKDHSVSLPLSAVPGSPGRYHAAVVPGAAGFYQANVLGDILGTPVSLSMHPPKVSDRSHIEFPPPPEPAGAPPEAPDPGIPAYAALAAGAAGAAMGAAALARSRRPAT